MSGGRERRTSVRKLCSVPLRFRVSTNGRNAQEEMVASYGMRDSKAIANAEMMGIRRETDLIMD